MDIKPDILCQDAIDLSAPREHELGDDEGCMERLLSCFV